MKEDHNAYDTIGNRTSDTLNGMSRNYAANCLNQYTQVDAAQMVYDTDGNLVRDDRFAYAYDAENRMLSARPIAPSEGDLAVVNAYDHKHRRVMKRVERFDGDEWQTSETHAFTYDGSNIVLERIAFANGTTRTVEYFWGNDLSGTEHGAGGVGGLVAVSVDGLFNIPCYDHNGNIVCYVSESGTIAAQYVYDPYGNVIEQHGMMPNQFNFGFSTKYLDREVGLVGYQYRFLRPLLGRWLNRDPKGEEGGVNLYAFCRNNSVLNIDGDGRAYFAVRKLNSKWLPDLATEDVHESIGGIMDRLNIQLLHEHLFFQDGKSPQNIGFCDVGIFFEDSMSGYIQTLGGYDDCIMRKAINRVSTPLYSLVGNILLGFMNKCNCQTYADMLRTEYSRLITDSSVRCDCRKEKNKWKHVVR